MLSPIMALQLQTVTSESTTLLVAKVSSARTLRLAGSLRLSLSRGCLSEWTRTPDSRLTVRDGHGPGDRVTHWQAQPSQWAQVCSIESA